MPPPPDLIVLPLGRSCLHVHRQDIPAMGIFLSSALSMFASQESIIDVVLSCRSQEQDAVPSGMLEHQSSITRI